MDYLIGAVVGIVVILVVGRFVKPVGDLVKAIVG